MIKVSSSTIVGAIGRITTTNVFRIIIPIECLVAWNADIGTIYVHRSVVCSISPKNNNIVLTHNAWRIIACKPSSVYMHRITYGKNSIIRRSCYGNVENRIGESCICRICSITCKNIISSSQEARCKIIDKNSARIRYCHFRESEIVRISDVQRN